MKYKILEGVTTADIAYKIYGKTLKDLFVNAAEAVMATVVDTVMVEPLRNFKFKISNLKLEELFLDFLNELVFLKDSKQMLFSRFDIKLKKLDAKRYSLDANVWGEKINPDKHKLKCDVKAVARHELEIKKDKAGYTVTIVLDV